jgi:hypothetical protein
VSFAAINLCVASQRVIPKISVYFVIDSIRKILYTASCVYVCVCVCVVCVCVCKMKVKVKVKLSLRVTIYHTIKIYPVLN